MSGAGFLKGSALLIGLYLVVANGTQVGSLLSSAGTAGSGFAKVLQARA